MIIMAAGMGSRYGGLKQMDPIDEYGHILMDYSAFDAKRAGFERLIIVIKPEMEELFEEKIGHRLRRHIAVDYACQVLDNLPSGFSVPEGRTKPWGTAHAVLSCRDLVRGEFQYVAFFPIQRDDDIFRFFVIPGAVYDFECYGLADLCFLSIDIGVDLILSDRGFQRRFHIPGAHFIAFIGAVAHIGDIIHIQQEVIPFISGQRYDPVSLGCLSCCVIPGAIRNLKCYFC